MERLPLTDDEIKRFSDSPYRQAFRVWTFTLIINDVRVELTPLAFDRSFSFEELWQDAYVQGLVDPVINDTVIFPNRRHLKLEAVYDYRQQLSGEETKRLKPKTLKFDVRLTEVEAKGLANPNVEDAQPLRMKDQTLTAIKLKIVDNDIMVYRDMACAGILHEATMQDVLELYLRPGATLKGVPRPPVIDKESYIYGEYTGIIGCQITPPDNDLAYPQVILPFDVNLCELPEFLQANYGLYKDGIASCIDRGIVYVFPIMKWERYDEEARTLTIINADSSSYAGLETTYLVDDMGKVEIVSTGDVRHVDNSDWIQLKHGLGKVWVDADSMLDGGIDRNPDDTIFASRGKLMKETGDVERSDELTRKRWSSNDVTANIWAEETTERYKRTSMISLGWEHSNHDVVYPGMPVMIKSQLGEKMVEIRGTLVSLHTNERKIKDGLTEDRFSSTTTLNILIPSVGI